MSIRIIIIFFTYFAFLAACSNSQDNKKIGQVLGAVSGSIIGSKIGKGTGKNLSIVSSTVIGSIVGRHLGEKISKSDMNIISNKTNEVLAEDEIGRKFSWKNPETGNSGYVESVDRFKHKNQDCREIKQVVKIDRKTSEIYSSACEQADGSWKISKN
tara:strand:- start:30 stop:500 length:471 start_codon:yes stop_codon:yes gene_type:complete